MKIVGGILLVLGFWNFAAHAIISTQLGGSAQRGTAADGRFYLTSHGERTEVSEAVWRYSRFHSVSLFITHPLALIGIILYAAGREEEKRRETKTANA